MLQPPCSRWPRIRPTPAACHQHDSGFRRDGSQCGGLRSWPHRPQPIPVGPSRAQRGPGSCRSIVSSFLPRRTSCWKSRGTTRSDPLVPPAAARPLCTRHGVRCPQTADLAEDRVAAGRSQALGGASSALSSRERPSERKRVRAPAALSATRQKSCRRGCRARRSAPRPRSGFLNAQRGPGRRDRMRHRHRVTGRSIPWALGPARTDSEPTSSLPSF